VQEDDHAQRAVGDGEEEIGGRDDHEWEERVSLLRGLRPCHRFGGLKAPPAEADERLVE